MKKLFALLVAVMFAFSATYAVDYSATALSVSGAGTDDANVTSGGAGIDDLSYDDAEGNYCIYVICPLTLTNIESASIDLGYINPDGSRMLPSEYMQWMVTGGDGWFFEANLKNDQFGWLGSVQSDYVYFVNPYWSYQIMGGSENNVTATPSSGDYDMEYYLSQLQLSGTVGGDDGSNSANPCDGKGYFTFYPNQVVATELATAGQYTWNVYLDVDYLTWTVPLDPDGTAYTQPGVTP